MPTIIQISVEGNSGSIGRIAEEIGSMVIKNGWTSYIAYGRHKRESKSNLIKIGTYVDIMWHGLITRFFDRQGFGSKIATKKLIKRISEIKPDIIHLHHLHGYFINIEILFNYLSKIQTPIIWTFHDCWSFTGHCTYFETVNCDKWKTECNKCPQVHEYPQSFLVDNSKSNFYIKKELFNTVNNLTIVNVSKWLNTIVGDSFLSNIPRQVIYNGIDLNKFSPISNNESTKEKYNLNNKFVILGVASPWGKRKRLKDYITISDSLKEDELIILVGLSRSQIKSLPKNIIGIERTESTLELAELYSIADVYLNMSIEETFGLTIAESLACGTPAIVFNSTACPELIDLHTGFIIEKNDFISVLQAISKVKENGKVFYTDACRSRILKYFSKENLINEYIELYSKLIQI